MGCFKLKSGRAASEPKYLQSHVNASGVWLEVEKHWGSKAAGSSRQGEEGATEKSNRMMAIVKKSTRKHQVC